jgi:hypothetical protein
VAFLVGLFFHNLIFGDRAMRQVVRFVVLTVAVTAVLGGLFVVVVGVPEPWQAQPWTVWERGARGLLVALGWPMFLAGMLLVKIGDSGIPDSWVGPLVFFLFVLSGAFWAAVIVGVEKKCGAKRVGRRRPG